MLPVSEQQPVPRRYWSWQECAIAAGEEGRPRKREGASSTAAILDFPLVKDILPKHYILLFKIDSEYCTLLFVFARSECNTISN